MKVQWQVISTTAHAGFVLEAVAQAFHDRQPAKGIGLAHHSDRGSHICPFATVNGWQRPGLNPR